MIIDKTQYKFDYYPKWFANKSTVAFIAAFALCSVVFGHVLPFEYAAVSILSVLVFFFAGRSAYRSWKSVGVKTFEKRLFLVGFLLRFSWVLYCYLFFNFKHYGYNFGDAGDTDWYMMFAKSICQWIQSGFKQSFSMLMLINDSAIDDVGYPFWLSILYFIFGVDNDVFIPMLVKCIVSAFCAVFVSRIARNHFGENVARVTGLFVMLNPNMIYWCGCMFKESEMVFLTCWYLYLMDKALYKSAKHSLKSILPAVFVGMYLFFFRSALGLVAFAAVLLHVVLASKKTISIAKKITLALFVIIVLLAGIGDNVRRQMNNVIDVVESDEQSKNMEWRSKRAGGNDFAKYASATVFAPLIFTIPFPTFSMANESQILQAQLSGGSFIKNIISFFVIFSMFSMLFSGEWRKHVFIVAFTCGYLGALVFSNFAQSGRFHMPIMPMLMLFGAYGISLVQKNKKWKNRYTLILFVEVFICIGWNWFKLKGRGLI